MEREGGGGVIGGILGETKSKYRPTGVGDYTHRSAHTGEYVVDSGSRFTYRRYGCDWRSWKGALVKRSKGAHIPIDWYRTRTISDADLCEQLMSGEYIPLSDGLWGIDHEDIDRAIQRLPDSQRAAFLLQEDGYTHAEIGEKLQCTEMASRKLIQRARKFLRHVLPSKTHYISI